MANADFVLTDVEQSLVEHVSRGEPLDLVAPGETVTAPTMRSWGNSRSCRAAVIRDILRGRRVVDPAPRGLRLRGARIIGRLDLENLTTTVNLELTDCLLEEGMIARDAHVPGIALFGCLIEHSSEPPLDAERLACGVLALNRAMITGHAGRGAVALAGATVSGKLDCTGTQLRNDSGPAARSHRLKSRASEDVT